MMMQRDLHTTAPVRQALTMGIFRAMLLAALLLPAIVFGYSAVQNKADHTEIRIVPAPGKVKVDGNLKDWDLSGAIFMFIDEASKPTHSLRAAMMYDKKYLYISGCWKDPTPMVNNYAFGGDVNTAWNADAIQIRFVSSPDVKSDALTMTGSRMPAKHQHFINHITLWYSTQNKKAGYYSIFTLKYNDPVLNPKGVLGAYVKDADGKGCTFEYRVPWKVLRAPRPLKGGDAVQMQFQIHWGNKKGTELKSGITDVSNPNSNALGYMGPGGWGLGRFMEKGNLPPAKKSSTKRAAGHIPVRFKLAKDGKVSISICDAKGRTVRTGIGAQPYRAGEHTWLWDGLDDRDRPLPAGKYTAKILTHDGIGQNYVCDVGVSGKPPYQTEDGKGGWAGDYWSPAYVAIDGDRVILGTGNAEAQKPTICTDLEGRKLYGTTALGLALAVHKGFGYFGRNGSLTKFNLANGQLTPFANGQPTAKVPVGRGLAVFDDATLVSATGANKLFLIDVATGTHKGEVAVAVPVTGGLAVDGKGRLYAVSGKAVGRVKLKTGAFTPVARKLDDPKMLACDAAGNLYVSLQGTTMQVWKLSRKGRVVRKFGKAGGRPALGKFNPGGMLNPYGIAVDKNRRLWVCEDDREPKRYSVWNPDGTLWKEFFGSLPYSTAGYFDPKDPEYFYAMSVRYKVDYHKGTWRPDATILRERTEGGVKLPQVAVHTGGWIVVVKGRKFMVVPEMYSRWMGIYEEAKDVWVPRLAFNTGRPASKLWIDANNDGKVQGDEVRPGGNGFAEGVVDQDLNFYVCSGNRWTEPRGEGRCTEPYTISRLDFLGFAPNGALQYAEKPKVVVQDREGGSVSSFCVDPSGAIYVMISGGLVARGERAQATGARIVKFSAKGKELWRYANVHCGFGWTSSTYTPGFVVAAFRNRSPNHPDLLPITGYYGQYFLIDKKDGLFVDALCQDQRSAYTMDQTMVLTENFNGNIFKHPKTGKSYFAGGDCDQRIWELTGIESLKRQSVRISMTGKLAAQAVKSSAQNKLAQMAMLARNSGRKSASLKRLTRAAADGKDAEWTGVPVLPLGDDKAKPAQVQLGYDEKNLYARFQVITAVPFRNTPTDFKQLFKSGSALELCLTPHVRKRQVRAHNVHPMQVGDLRIVIARTADGKLMATRYRPKIQARKKPFAAYFETQAAGRENFDEIAAWDDLPMSYRAVKGGYVVEVAVPWNATAVKPAAGLKFLADAGVIYGNAGGNRNAARAMWSDRTPEVGVNNDIPTECRMHPNGWGLVVVE